MQAYSATIDTGHRADTRREQPRPNTIAAQKRQGKALSAIARIDGRTRRARRHNELAASVRAEFVAVCRREPSPLEDVSINLIAGLSERTESIAAIQIEGRDPGDELVRVANALRRERAALGLTATLPEHDDEPTTPVAPSINWERLIRGGGDGE